MNDRLSFIGELKRRNVFRVAIAYALMGWLLLQMADFALDLVDAPNWIIQVFFIAVLVGLPIALFFSWAFELTPEGIKRESEVDRSQSIAPATGQKLNRMIISFLLAIIVVLGVERVFFARLDAPAEVDTSSAETKSIAVLPFVNMSSDAEQEFFSDGISEEILNSLAKVKALKVAGRTSSFAFKGKNEDLRLIGDTLGVDHILEGSVRKAGDQVRVTAQLIQVEDGFHLWSETYDRELTDIFAIQDEIAGEILAAMRTTLEVTETPSANTVDVLVYDQYLLGRQKLREREEASIQEALSLLSEVNVQDPDFAPAWGLRAVGTILNSNAITSYGSAPLGQAIEQAQQFIDQALALDPNDATALAASGLVALNRNEFAEGIQWLDKALTINPGLTDASNWLWGAQYSTGLYRDALETNLRIRRLDPLYLPTVANLTFDYFVNGDTVALEEHIEEVSRQLTGISSQFLAEAELMLAISQSNMASAYRVHESMDVTVSLNHWMTSWALMHLGDYERAVEVGKNTPGMLVPLAVQGKTEEADLAARPMLADGLGINNHITALAMAQRWEDIISFIDERWDSIEAFEAQSPPFDFSSGSVLGHIAHALRSTGDDERSVRYLARFGEVIEQLEREDADHLWFTFARAHYAMLIGDEETALAELEQFANEGNFMPPDFVRFWTAFTPLRGHPRFELVSERMTETLNRQRAQLDLPPYEPVAML